MIFPPSSYPNDPQGYAANQAGHAFIGLALAVALTLTVPAAYAWVIAGAGYWLVWERLWQRGANLRDSYEDAVFVTCGAAIWCGGDIGALLVTLALMALGVWRRT